MPIFKLADFPTSWKFYQANQKFSGKFNRWINIYAVSNAVSISRNVGLVMMKSWLPSFWTQAIPTQLLIDNLIQLGFS